MLMNKTVRRVVYIFLCLLPFIVFVVGGARSLRIPGVYQIIGFVLFAATVTASCLLIGREITDSSQETRRNALAGALLISPFAVISLLWVGLGTPWDATPAENQMRYLVLLFGSIAVTTAFIILKEALGDAGERFFSTPGFAFSLLGGAAYLVWLCFEVGAAAVKARSNQISPAIIAMSDLFDIIVFTACLLTYLATASYAASFARARWLSRGAARAYVVVSLIAVLFLLMRGLSFPDPTADATPWYMRPGFIVGIPAIPWLMPYLLGVNLLRKSGDMQTGGAAKAG